MSFLSQPVEHNSKLLFVNFNQDSSSLQTGSKTGFKLYPLNSVENLEFTHENNERPNIHLVERLFASSLVALVSSDHPRKLDVCHFKKGSEICNYSYSNAILAVKLNRMRLVVCLEESLYIHNIRDMKVLHTIRDTPPNPKGICALSPHNEHAYLAYPGSVQTGEVQIFDTIALRAVINISAHDNPLAAVAFNPQGTRLATASEKGTVIRIFSLPDGAKLFEFRRGLKRCADIQCLAFSVDSVFLCTCSNTETVHIFKLEEQKEKPQEDTSWMGILNSTFRTSASYLPAGISDVMNQGRSFATARLPHAGLKSVCTIAPLQKIPRLLVATHEGHLYIYNIDPNEGGECTLLRTHMLEGQPPEHASLLEEGSSDRPLTQTGHHDESSSYAASVRRPQSSNSSEAMAPTDSLPYQDLMEGAVGGEEPIGALRIHDDSEFPPMSHKSL
ncbi:WD repeat domain phosphoinositide-interacting protein 2-like isoform X3 [Biomphalaria glabrata]|uniref:WD repeat domain phosphoinositide-interacting protein 2-like isoform X3 n=2 Tax=Biomphalaria TaxID=6525 RepID=A0A2C9JFZ4_BIOGL|nr:WD repeat domain phosphoinositide-interacting protein 2-like isoform X3 [Biomphalaria glabrata]KAI8765525.1 WD repeat domain phosphoinositide-interacting protein 2-like isoform X2 [Biomphalaria glabrata]KAI8797510.1 WD repeat domain phosphoinositide-interacting protein 2 isoform X2 [Biomphalaria glabrata]KAK0059047.1 WD repeat domain phosphoinositide-interacting protein 2-like isoform X2 [Biomphalaria pfeifferi]